MFPETFGEVYVQMTGVMRKLLMAAAALFVTAGLGMAQTGALEGNVIGPDGQPLKGALVKIDRKDIKGAYKVKTDKKGHYLHVGLPLGTYRVAVEMDGKELDVVDNVKTRLGDPLPVDFNLKNQADKQAAIQKAAETGQVTQEMARDMSPAQKAALEKQMKERTAAMAKNKELNDAYNAGNEAMQAKNFQAAAEQFDKASKMELGATQPVIWSHLAESYTGLAATKTGAEQTDALGKSFVAWQKAIELQPADASFHNNYALALSKAKKFDEMQAELAKAVQLDPPGAGRYYFNLGAVLTNSGQQEQACEAFKKAIDADKGYADAQYQYGVCLMAKSSTTPDGKLTAPPGAKEAFESYLALKPDGKDAEGAKAMLTAMGSTVQSTYKNPNAPAKPANKAPAPAAPAKKK